MLLKPRFGMRMCSGIWPPSKPLIATPERALAPFWPRPAVLPSPEPMPRPTRRRGLRAPLPGLIEFSSICSSFCAAAYGSEHLHEVRDLVDHAAHRCRVFEGRFAVQLAQAEAAHGG